MHIDKKSLAARYRRDHTYCQVRNNVTFSPWELVMITVLLLLSIVAFVALVGGLATSDVYRQTHAWAARQCD
jgi:hypothetical protein